MENILDVPAHFYENEPKPQSVKIYDTAISQTEGIWSLPRSLPNPQFKTRPLVGSIP